MLSERYYVFEIFRGKGMKESTRESYRIVGYLGFLL